LSRLRGRGRSTARELLGEEDDLQKNLGVSFHWLREAQKQPRGTCGYIVSSRVGLGRGGGRGRGGVAGGERGEQLGWVVL